MHKLPKLQPGDSVKIVAPASACLPEHLNNLKLLIESWGLNCIVDNDIFGDDILCANSDAQRLSSLRDALLRPDIKAIICARGGYGSLRLIPDLTKITSPGPTKLFLGMSDITALNLYLLQQWQWPVVHGSLSLDRFSPESIAAVRAILFGETSEVTFLGRPLNDLARKNISLKSEMTGGNLCLVQTSIGTAWQMNGRNKIILLEEVSERGYRIDRMLEQLNQSGLIKDATAILFGDFTGGNELDGSNLVIPVLERFAKNCEIPVMQIAGVGHGYVNFPVPLGTTTQLILGNEIKVVCSR